MISNIQYQTTLINVTNSDGSISRVDCSKTNPANTNKLLVSPQRNNNGVFPAATSTLYQCGAPTNINPAPTGTAKTCQNGIAGCLCVNGVSSRCAYSINDITGNSPDDLLLVK